jgi:uncharacterized protein (TIGR02328 family)
MRLWHYKLISYLPKSQLKSQWRELNSIFKKQDKHILINYIYEYSKGHLLTYTKLVIEEMNRRKIKIKKWEHYNSYFYGFIDEVKKPFNYHHNDQYLIQCFYNLQEKYDRGQKDFSEKEYRELVSVVAKEWGKDGQVRAKS